MPRGENTQAPVLSLGLDDYGRQTGPSDLMLLG